VFFFLQLPALGFLSAADEIGAHTGLTDAEAVTARGMRGDLDLRMVASKRSLSCKTKAA